jgi:catechol 2,3-dioxygenase-like lactoylglutathione lyase family enzyme
MTLAGHVVGIDHVQIAVPLDSEPACRSFYLGLLGLKEIERPRSGEGRSFLWVKVGDQEVHFRPDAEFRPARFAHPGFLVSDGKALAKKLAAAGYEVSRADAARSGRFHVRDPFGNRLEFVEADQHPDRAVP